MRKLTLLFAATALLLSLTAAPAAADMLECKLSYKMKGWSLVVKKAEGNGVIRCSDGSETLVHLELVGGGLTAGKTKIDDGVGNFSDVESVDELLGHYAAAEASAGAAKASEALALTKGEVSLGLAGVGRGWSVGISGLRFTITKRGGDDDGDDG